MTGTNVAALLSRGGHRGGIIIFGAEAKYLNRLPTMRKLKTTPPLCESAEHLSTVNVRNYGGRAKEFAAQKKRTR